MAIKLFNTLAEYEASVKSKTESAVNFIESQNCNIMDGVNVGIGRPVKGSAVVLDDKNNIRFIAPDTFSQATFAGEWTKIGVVVNVEGNIVTIMHWKGINAKMANCWQFVVTGFDKGQGVENSIVIRSYARSSTEKIIGTLTYTLNGATAEERKVEFKGILDTYLRANDDAPTPNNWHAELLPDYQGNEQVTIVNELCDQWYQQYTPIKSGATCAMTYFNALDACSSAKTYGNINFGFPAANRLAYLGRAKSNGRTPTAQESVTSTTQEPVSPTAFETSEYCANLRAAFPTFDDYIKSRTIVQPSQLRAMAIDLDHNHTKIMCDKTYIDKSGKVKILSPAYNYAGTLGYNHPEFAIGKWGVPNVREMAHLMKDVTYCTDSTWVNYNIDLTSDRSKADVVNRTLYAMGGTDVNVAGNRWASVRNNAYHGWIWYGFGYLNYSYNWNYSHLVAPLVLLELA